MKVTIPLQLVPRSRKVRDRDNFTLPFTPTGNTLPSSMVRPLGLEIRELKMWTNLLREINKFRRENQQRHHRKIQNTSEIY
jgi:hypothetical protein